MSTNRICPPTIQLTGFNKNKLDGIVFIIRAYFLFKKYQKYSISTLRDFIGDYFSKYDNPKLINYDSAILDFKNYLLSKYLHNNDEDKDDVFIKIKHIISLFYNKMGSGKLSIDHIDNIGSIHNTKLCKRTAYMETVLYFIFQQYEESEITNDIFLDKYLKIRDKLREENKPTLYKKGKYTNKKRKFVKANKKFVEENKKKRTESTADTTISLASNNTLMSDNATDTNTNHNTEIRCNFLHKYFGKYLPKKFDWEIKEKFDWGIKEKFDWNINKEKFD